MSRAFTGWHMTGILVAFFAVVIGVNVVMATDAVRTFGGVVVENSYVASQKFDGWLDAARAQHRLGWRAKASVGEGGRLHVQLTGARDAVVRVRADHPLGREPSRTFAMRALGNGGYLSDEAIGSGRWLLRIEATAGGKAARFEDEVGK